MNPPDVRSVPLWRDWLVVSLLATAYLLPFVYALPFIDGVRDIQVALDISYGKHFPLTGPIFGSRFHLGPVFYYVQALPLMLGGEVASVPLYLGLLAATKFPLAYGMGRAWMGRRYGLLFAAALAIPGWSGLDILNTTTPMLVPTMLLATAWFALAYIRSGSTVALVGAWLAGVLAVHAHPSAVVIALLLITAVSWHAIRKRHWRGTVVAVLAAMLPLLPMTFALIQSGPDAVYPAGLTVVQAGSGHSIGGWLDALRGYIFGGPLTTLRTLGSAEWGMELAWIAAATGGVGCVLAMARGAAGDRRAQCLLVALVAVAVAVFAVRASTPWYFVQSLTVIYAAISALGWGTWHRAAGVLPVIVLLQAFAQSGFIARHIASGEGNFPGAELMDVRRARGEIGPQIGAWLSVREWGDLADLSCSLLQDGQVSLHGEIAAIIDDHGALPIRAACDTEGLRLGGRGVRNIVGIPRAVWGALPWPPVERIGSVGLFDAAVQASKEEGHALSDPRVYPLRQPIGSVVSTREHHLETPANALLVVSRLSSALSVFNVTRVRVGNQEVTPIYQDAHMLAFRLRRPEADVVIWSVEVTSTAHEWVDVAAIAPPKN